MIIQPERDSCSKTARLKTAQRVMTALTVSLIFVLLVLSTACKTQGGGGNNAGDSAAREEAGSAAGETYATPPFSTKEPERYRARMVLTLQQDEQEQITSTLIIRDGEKRREEFEPQPGFKVADLKIPAGHFLLLPEKQIYAEVKPESSGSVPAPEMNLPEEFAPDLLLNESRTEARYEKLGVEELNGRSATKYRVRVYGAAGEDRSMETEQLIWIDERLGMPVRSETGPAKGSGRTMKYAMELRDLQEEVDPSAFVLPQDYKKVLMKEILSQLPTSTRPAPLR